jgi:subtilase family serine protease
MGVTIVAATGDDGVGGFLVRNNQLGCGYWAMYPASSPFVVAVGGTQVSVIP